MSQEVVSQGEQRSCRYLTSSATSASVCARNCAVTSLSRRAQANAPAASLTTRARSASTGICSTDSTCVAIRCVLPSDVIESSCSVQRPCCVASNTRPPSIDRDLIAGDVSQAVVAEVEPAQMGNERERVGGELLHAAPDQRQFSELASVSISRVWSWPLFSAAT